MPSKRELLQVLREVRRRHDGGLTLEQLAERAGWSPFHLHRTFSEMVGETPKGYSLRLRLERAAARLVSTRDSVLDIALATGFRSHEVFTRAFRRQFGQTPASYRTAALPGASTVTRARHAAFVEAAGPCVALFHLSTNPTHRSVTMPTLSIERREIAAQPILFARLRPGRHELSSAIGEGLGKVFPYSQSAGLAIAGRPFTRYLSTGPGLFSIEVGIPIASAGPGRGEVEAGSLPGGPVAVAMHAGSYDQLVETYAALQRWIEANGFRIGGPPWESYITDPAEFPDPADWKTEVYWPLEK
jgi:AraC family transcriptional regulator